MKDKKSRFSWDKYIHDTILGRHMNTYLPFYDEFADFQTNAKSYYDYLARYNKALQVLGELVNMLLARDIDVLDTNTIKFTKIGEWIPEDECESIDELIKLMADVKISNRSERLEILDKVYTLGNSIQAYQDGIFSPDYKLVLNDMMKIIKELESDISNIDNKDILDRLDELEKIINNLQGLDLKRLVLDRDYKIHFHNGFYSPSNDLVLSVGETKEIIDVHITTHSTSGKILKHDGDLRDTRQSLRPDKDIPETSKVFSIEFLNDYKYLNNKEVYLEMTTPIIWHISPSSQRPSWAVQLTPHNINNMINFSWRNFSDGYSRQLKDTYTEPLKLDYGMVESKITFKK